MKIASILRDLAYGTEIVLCRPLDFEYENEFDKSLEQQNSDSLYGKGERHK
jgi:hypothetical protein